jgi:Phage portal protein, SPP1 Gp6-like
MAPEVMSPEWWRDRLLRRYQHDLQERLIYARLYDSRQDWVETLPQYHGAYRRLIGMARTPWPRLVVDIVAERLNVIGVRFANGPNDLIWTMLRSSHVEALQNQVHQEAITLGTSYVSVWPNGVPKLAWESGLTVTHELEPGDPHTVAAAIKVWEDTIRGTLRVNVYLPNATHFWTSEPNPTTAQPESEKSPTNRLSSVITNGKWAKHEETPNRWGKVPIIPFPVKPTWDGYGRSDLYDLGPVFARIENVTTNILLAIELGAFRQRWATGLDVPRDPTTDQPIEPFKVALDRLWVSEDENTKFGSFDATDVNGYLKAVSDAVGQLSAVSRIPVTYFVQTELANPPSAASLEASETGLINKVRDRQDTFAESWEEVVRLAIQMSTDFASLAELEPLSILWKDPRTRSESQTLDAAIKLQSIGTPWESVMEFIGYGPEEIAQMRAARMADTFERLINTPVATAPALAIGRGGTAVPPGEQPQ